MNHVLKNIKEIPPNKGGNDKSFEEEMRLLGWNLGGAGCAIFTKYIYKRFDLQTLQHQTYKDISVNCMTSFNKMRSQAQMEVIVNPGSLIFWQSKRNATQGHTGIFLAKIDANTIISLEGNTDADGAREGDGIYIKKRRFKDCGFNFKGFIPCAQNKAFEAYIGTNVNLLKASGL